MDNIRYITRQLQSLYPGDCSEEVDLAFLELARQETEVRFHHLATRANILMRGTSEPDPWHIMKHPIYLYILTRVLYEKGLDDPFRIKDRVYCLNKALHGCSLFYRVKLPAVFFLNYATQVVLGDCTYGENLVVYQGVTVGASPSGVPVIGNDVVLMPNCNVSGKTHLGDNVVVSAGVVIANQSVPDNTLVFTSPKGPNNLVFHPLKDRSYSEFFISNGKAS